MKNLLWNQVLRWKIWSDTHGQDMVEYALMAGFITVAVAAAFPPVGDEMSKIFSKLTSSVDKANAL
jgi:pilus assembly protein Flp/PilA